MSVIIKGMKMPKSCKDCPCREYPKFSFESNWCCLNQKTISDVRVISPNCPLVEIPTPHGRLIDAGEIKEYAEWHCQRFIEGDHAEVGLTVDQINSFVRNAPTIIEAEVSE